MGLDVGVGDFIPTFFLGSAFNTLADFKREFREPLNRNLLARIQQAKHILNRFAHFVNQLDTPPVQQPPAQTQVAPVGLEVVAVGLLEIVVVVVLEVDARC